MLPYCAVCGCQSQTEGLSYRILIVKDEEKGKIASLYPTPNPDFPRILYPSMKQQVLLVTYGRSGSSFTSALIAHDPHVFYTFEPLHGLTQRRRWNKGGNTTIEQDSKAVLSAYLSCKVPAKYAAYMFNLHSGKNKFIGSAKRCLNSKAQGYYHIACFMSLLETCAKKRVTFIKTIRFRIRWAEWFMQHNPNFKLLFLVRDPRATIYSQARHFKNVGWTGPGLQNFSRKFCNTVDKDLKAAENFNKLYPGRVKAIRYEFGAKDPFAYTQEIYEFLGLEYTNKTESYIASITGRSRKDRQTKQTYSVVRSNSSQAMNAWRFSVDLSRLRIIDKECANVYPKVAYKPAPYWDYLKSQRPLFYKPPEGSLFTN